MPDHRQDDVLHAVRYRSDHRVCETGAKGTSDLIKRGKARPCSYTEGVRHRGTNKAIDDSENKDATAKASPCAREEQIGCRVSAPAAGENEKILLAGLDRAHYVSFFRNRSYCFLKKSRDAQLAYAPCCATFTRRGYFKLPRANLRQVDIERLIRAARKAGAVIHFDMRTLVATIVPMPIKSSDGVHFNADREIGLAPDGRENWD